MSPGKERNLECPQKRRWVTVAAEGSEVRLPGRLEARANRLMQAMPWIFTLSSKQRESIAMFQPWNGRQGQVCVSKRSPGLPGENGFVESQQWRWPVTQLAIAEVQARGEGD